MAREGLRVDESPSGPGVVLGEAGRGRRRTTVPVLGTEVKWVLGPAPFAQSCLGVARYVQVGTSPDGPLLRAVPGPADDLDRVLVLLNAAGGWRGGVTYTLPDSAQVLATGTVVLGDAGRAGGWDELLVVLPVPCEVPFATTGGGGHEGGPEWLRVETGGLVTVEGRDARNVRLAKDAVVRGEVRWL